MTWWAAADAYILSEAQTVFGSGGEYSTLPVREFISGNVEWKPADWRKPTLLVASRDVRPSDEEFGNILGVHTIYDYWISVVQEGTTYNTVSENSKDYYARLIKFMHERRTLGGLTSGGEATHKVLWQRGQVDIQERNAALYWGITTLLFQIETSR